MPSLKSERLGISFLVQQSLKAGFSTEYMGRVSFAMQWVTASVISFHCFLLRSYFWEVLVWFLPALADWLMLHSFGLLSCFPFIAAFTSARSFPCVVHKWASRFNVFPLRAIIRLRHEQQIALPLVQSNPRWYFLSHSLLPAPTLLHCSYSRSTIRHARTRSKGVCGKFVIAYCVPVPWRYLNDNNCWHFDIRFTHLQCSIPVW